MMRLTSRLTRLRGNGAVLHRTTSSLIDFNEPHLWYAQARRINRIVTCHVGPTNSGKTHEAIQHLIAAEQGCYCSPLRLLALEKAEELKSLGIACDLITGNEQVLVDKSTHISSTVEMTNLSKRYDVAVIDEAQLIGSEDRGWAWTQALLGLQAQKVFLCGSASMLPVVERICQLTKDRLVVRHFDRLSPLAVSKQAIHSLHNVQAGDCVVAFSRRSLYDLKKIIEKNPKLKCGMIYGSLPPEARKEQAKLFNDSNSEYNVLVATDAVGMGLNLSIKRVVFSSLEKYDGKVTRPLDPSEVKQIAGRAGRYKSMYPEGIVTCVYEEDLPHLHHCISTPDSDILKAGIAPQLEHLKLLDVFLKYSVTSKTLLSFWEAHHSEILRDDSDSDDHSKENYTLTSNKFSDTEAVINSFGSIRGYELALEEFLEDNFVRETGDADEVLKPLSKRSSRIKRRSTPLAKLFKILKGNIEMRKDSPYFLCDLSDMEMLAEALSHINMTLNEKFEFCKAPVSDSRSSVPSTRKMMLDNMKQHLDSSRSEFSSTNIQWFVYFAWKFAESRRVRLPKYLSVSNSFVPSTQLDMLRIEDYNKIFEFYIWLAMRFPSEFPDLKRAEEESKQCATLIDTALKSDKFLSIKGTKKSRFNESLQQRIEKQQKANSKKESKKQKKKLTLT